MIILFDNLKFCFDCLFAAVNDDYTVLDYNYSSEEAAVRMEVIQAGLRKWGPHLVPDFDSETGDGIEEFSSAPCDCCGSRLAGERYRFVVLGQEK